MKLESIIQEIKNAPQYSESRNRFLKIQVCSLREEELEELISYFKSDSCIDDSVLRILNSVLLSLQTKRSFRESFAEKNKKRNEPVKLLLEWYNDRKSGKVVYARKCLHERFLHLSYTEQYEIILSFLKGGRIDREWCYNMLRKWWTADLEEIILETWDTYHEERCGWLFPKHMPLDVIHKHVDELCYDSNYYSLCKRLAAEEWFEIDKNKLRVLADNDTKYMWIMSMSKKGLTSEEALCIIFNRIVDVITFYKSERDYDGPFGSFRKTTDFVDLSSTYVEDNFYMYKLKDVENMLSCMCRMGLQEDVRQFLIFDQNIHDMFQAMHMNDFDVIRTQSDVSKTVCIESLFTEFASFYAKYIPPQYKKLLYQKGITIDSCEDSSESVTLTESNKAQRQNQDAVSKAKYEDLLQSNPRFNDLVEKLGLEIDGELPPF